MRPQGNGKQDACEGDRHPFLYKFHFLEHRLNSPLKAWVLGCDCPKRSHRERSLQATL
ncbi:MAG: hypothetical protein F6K35_22280 [Okeania sp. SIO2H7]|nr:hypothetical protein [Okeania sp. SIO2H7]